MMTEIARPPTRTELTRALVVNAATKPVNVAVPAAVAVAGLLLGQPWLVAIALVVYAVLATMTFFDVEEAESAGRRLRVPAAAQAETEELALPIRRQLAAALRQEQLLREAVEESPLEWTALSEEIDGLVLGLRTIARRANRLHAYLAAHDQRRLAARVAELRSEEPAPDRDQLVAALEDQLDTMRRMDRQLTRFFAEMEHASATLATMCGQLVQMTVDAAESMAEVAERTQ